jgi:hypothetical protein
VTHWGPFKAETVRGSPIRLYGRTLTPVVRLVSAIGHRGTIKTDHVEGTGWGVVYAKPLGIIEERGEDTRTLPIGDATGKVLRQMAIVAAILPLLSLALVLLNRVMRKR